MPYALAEFNHGNPIVALNLADIMATKTVCLCGPSLTGKTAFAIAVTTAPVGSNVIKISTMEHLRQVTAATTAIVFDDMDFNNCSTETMLQLLNPEWLCSIELRNVDAEIPAGCHRIITTNHSMGTILPPASSKIQKAAMDRRMHVLTVTEHLF